MRGRQRKIYRPHSNWPTTPSSGASIAMEGCRPPSVFPARPSASSSANVSPPPGTIRPASPATACDPGSRPAPRRPALRLGASGKRRATLRTPCWLAISATASCSSTMQLGRCSERVGLPCRVGLSPPPRLVAQFSVIRAWPKPPPSPTPITRPLWTRSPIPSRPPSARLRPPARDRSGKSPPP